MKKRVFVLLLILVCIFAVAQEIINQNYVYNMHVEQSFRQNDELLMEFESFKLYADSGSLMHDIDIQLCVLKRNQTESMPGNMVNTTGDLVEAYRLLPNGEHFSSPAMITLPYDFHKIPVGYTAEDVYSYFYDTEVGHWTQLERVAVDTTNHTITSLTTHFTDFANAVIKTPEMPEANAFVPTAMTDLPDVNPLQGIPMIAAPQANNRGTVELTYPIELPKGRRGLQPNVDLHYSSAGGNGVLGVGWSIQTPAITIDTRWGVPRYSLADETEAYLLNGEQILMHDSMGNLLELAHKSSQFEPRKRGDIRFYARDRRNQDYIIRSGNSPRDYYWTVTDRSGTTYYYGYNPFTEQIDDKAVLTDSKGNIAEWSLAAVVDVYGNYVLYNYSKDYSCKTRKNIEKYIESIEYTGNVNTLIDPTYSVRFFYNGQRKDTISDGRLGFLRQTARTVCTILVECQDKPIASYVMDYDSCSAQTLNKMRLKAITKYDAHAIQCRHIDIRTPEWTEYDKSSSANEYLNKIEKGLLENEGDATGETIPGSRTMFNYCNAVPISDLFSRKHKTASLENLGENVSQTFGGGSSFVVGIGGNVGETSNSVGGNFDINYGLGKTNAMMIDLNGDGLPDYVRDNGQSVSYRRQNPNGDFDGFVTINGLKNLVREHNLSYGLGVQASFGIAQVSASPLAFSNSFTDTYFADVNNDRLPDLITPNGILINHLDADGTPTFEQLTGDLIETTDRKCSKIVRNGAVDTRLECELSYVYDQVIPWEKICTNSFLENKEEKKLEEDKIVEDLKPHVSEIPVEKLIDKYCHKEDEYIIGSERSKKYDDEIPISLPIPMEDERAYLDMKEEQIIRYPDLEELLSHYKAPDYKVESTVDGLVVYRLEQSCSNMDSLPHVDVVRVWVADKQSRVRLNSKIRLLNNEARYHSRKADGVKYSIQWCHNVNQIKNTSSYAAGTNSIISQGYLDSPSVIPALFDTIFTVSEGDILLFRLSARDNHSFDDTEWLQEIVETQTQQTYKSYEDFYCWNEDYFKATRDGSVDINVDVDNLQAHDITISVCKNSQVISSRNVTGGTVQIACNTTVDAGDSIWVSVGYINEPQWSKVRVKPVITYYASDFSTPIEYQIGSKIEGGVSHISFRNDKKGTRYMNYKALFGELHKNWGQFAYNNVNDDRVILLQDLTNYVDDMSAKLKGLRTNNTLKSKLLGYENQIEASKNNVKNGIQQSSDGMVSMPDFMDEYNPYSISRRWVPMQADLTTNRWVTIGNLGAIGDSLHSTSLQSIDGPDTTSLEVIYYDSSIPVSVDGSNVKTILKHSYSYHPNASAGVKNGPTTENAHISGGYNEVTSDFMDMNGDGYPDFIGRNAIQYTNPWGGIGDIVANKKKSYRSSNVSAGVGLSGSKSFAKEQVHNGLRVNKTYNAGLSTSTDYSYSKVNVTYMDVNGDGLPDMVHQGGGDEKNRVCYNIGYGFTDEYELPNDMEINTSHNLSSLGTDNVGLSARFDIEQHSISGGVSYNESKNTTTYSMIDLDGDGYLDKVHFSGSLAGGDPTLEVSRNMFNQKWEGPTTLRHCNNPSSITSNVSTTASFTAGFTMMGVKVLANPQLAPYSRSKTESKMELLDMNGDGFVDLVDGGVVYYNVNGLQPTNLLTSVTNPTGHVIDLNYTQSEPTVEHAGRSWLLASAYDHLPTGYDVDKRASMGKKFVYKDAYFDTYEKSDYGYDTVRTIEYNNADRVYRELVQIYANEDFINHGELQQDSLSDGHHPYVVNKYNTLFGHVDAPNKVDVCDDKNMVRFREEYHTCYYEGHPTAEIETAYMLEYDQYHNMIRRMDWGDVAVNNDDIEQLITYRTPSQHNLISLPIKEEVRSGGNAIRLSEMDYNAVGSPVAIRLYNNTTIAETNMQYDVYGNMIEALSPENGNRERVYLHYAYDPETETYPVFICNQFGETQLTKYDIRFGVPLIVVDPTGTAIQYRYDPMGRLIDIIAPQEDNVNMPTVHYDYHLPFHNVRPYIYSSSSPDFGFPFVTKVMFAKTQLSGAEVTLYDARGADLQKKVWQNVGGINMWVVQGHTEMDEFGRVIGMTTPFKSQMSVGTYDPNWQGTSAAMTNMKYDIMDRKCAVIHPDGKDQQFDFDFAYDNQNILRFCQTVKNENGISSISLLSPQGWNIQQINPMGQVTKFRYNALGELVAATDADGYTTQYQYDLLGRMTERSHPDAGRTQWSYDAMGNMVAMNTEALRQAGLVIKYSYSYNRLVEVNYPIHKDLDVKYKYYSDGRLAQREDACGTEDFTYDELGNVKQSDRWIYVPSENKSFLFVHRYNYDSFGRIQSIVYPDNDSVTYHYCESGQLDYVNHTYQGVTSPIIKSYEYDEVGRKTRIVYGNNVLSDFQYSQDRNWLKRTATFSPTTNSMLQNLSYQYDAVGNITDITQAAGPTNSLGGNYHNHYDYDNLNRLVDSYSRGGAFDYDFQITMSPTGRIGSKFLNTPSGNVLSDQTHGYDMYHITHQPRVVFDAARGYQSLFWDANGNLSQSIDCNTGGAQLNFWDEENRLRMTVNPKFAGYYGYDASGERVYKLTGHTQYDDMNGSNPLFGIIFDRLTLYPSPYIVLSEKQYTKHFYAGTEKIATLIGDGGLLLKEGSLEPEHIGRLKEGFYQSFHIDPSQFNYTKNVDIQDKAIDEVQYQCKYIEQVDIKLDSIYPMLKPMLDYWKNVYGNNNDIFYTHANHLGSASWITDKNGKPIQYIHYAPYGELIANQNGYGYDERFKFTGKERDEESGYDFFGARYYDHRKGFWNSVDPLADKYPGNSPYLHCNGNPVMFVDPDGRFSINMIDETENRPGFATFESGNQWIYTHDRDNKSPTLYLLFHFKKNASQQEIEDKITSLSINMHIDNWKFLLESGAFADTEDQRSHIVLQACYGSQIAEELAKQYPGVYVSGASGKLGSTKTPTGYKNVRNVDTKTVTRFFFFKTEETVDAQWFTYYYDSATKELKKWEYTQAEPPQIPQENE